MSKEFVDLIEGADWYSPSLDEDDIHLLPPCAGCGICCHLTPRVEPEEEEHIPEDVMDWNNTQQCVSMRKDQDGWCVALDKGTGLCKIYANRPANCREFYRGCEVCLRLFNPDGTPKYTWK